jgi:hypothetical protein
VLAYISSDGICWCFFFFLSSFFLCLLIISYFHSISDKKESFYSVKEDKDEQKEFETGPLSILMNSVKQNTQVGDGLCMLCYAVLCCAMLCCAMLCCAVLCCAMLCYVMLCYAVLC